MKILHVLPGLTRGGAERVVVDLANEHARRNHDVTILTLFAADAELAPGPLDPRIELRSILATAASHRSAYPRLIPWTVGNRRFLLDQDIVHVHLTGPAILGSVVQLLRRVTGLHRPAVVETYHAVGMAIPAWKRKLHSLFLTSRDGVALMAEDRYWRDFRDRQFGRLVRLIPNGVSTRPATSKTAAAMRRDVGIPPHVRLVGSVGRLKHERRPDALVRAFAEAARILPSSVHLLLGGEGPAHSDLTELARQLGIGDRVHFCGLVRDPAAVFDNLELYMTINVGPITGIAALEAASSGLPVVAFQMTPRYIPSDRDWIWSSTDPAELGRHVAALVSDEDARRALADAQRQLAQERHSIEAMANAYAGLYRDALNRRGGRTDANQ